MGNKESKHRLGSGVICRFLSKNTPSSLSAGDFVTLSLDYSFFFNLVIFFFLRSSFLNSISFLKYWLKEAFNFVWLLIICAFITAFCNCIILTIFGSLSNLLEAFSRDWFMNCLWQSWNLLKEVVYLSNFWTEYFGLRSMQSVVLGLIF